MPAVSDEGNGFSEIIMEEMSVSGVFKAGSLHASVNVFSVSGQIDVSAGGYLTNEGPGSFSFAFCKSYCEPNPFFY